LHEDRGVPVRRLRRWSHEAQRAAPGDLPAGQDGALGAPGANGAPGPAGPLPDVLPSGRTLRGSYEDQAPNGGLVDELTSFAFALATAPATHLWLLGNSNPDPVHCTGSPTAPQAAPGHLCVYEGSKSTPGVSAMILSGDRFGFTPAYFHATGGFSAGTWAVTAP